MYFKSSLVLRKSANNLKLLLNALLKYCGLA